MGQQESAKDLSCHLADVKILNGNMANVENHLEEVFNVYVTIPVTFSKSVIYFEQFSLHIIRLYASLYWLRKI